jgi:hypothetical protein
MKEVLMMTPGATPTHTFNVPIDAEEIAAVRISYEQNGKILLSKNKEDCTLSGKQIIVKLSQEDSLKFDSNVIVRIQLKIRTTGDDVIISDIIKKTTNIVLDKAVI